MRVYEVTAAGVNYADTHQTEDSYLAPQRLPLVPGAEFAGTGPDGRRVVGLVGAGGYAERVAAADVLVWPIPDGVSDGAALAVVLQGVTAWHLLRTSAHLAAGESVVVHAAAGGVGTVAVQLARAWGAGRVIATASSPEKRELALSLGADVAVDPAAEDLTAALREANGGSRVDVVLEMTGGPVFDASLRALAPFGRLVTFGMAARTPPTPVDPAEPDGPLDRGDRLLAGALLRRPGPLAGRPGDRATGDGRRRAAARDRRRDVPARRRGRGAPGAAGPAEHRQAGARPAPVIAGTDG